MIAIINRLITGEGLFHSKLPDVNFMYSTQHTPLTPVMYDPSIVIVLQGQKIGPSAIKNLFMTEIII